jgi:glycosyltransferase involved in cell wall biosynthesis
VDVTAGPLDVLVVFDGSDTGPNGAERMAVRSVAGLAARGHRVVLLTRAPASHVDGLGTRVVRTEAELDTALPYGRPAVVHLFDLAQPGLVDTAVRVAARTGAPLALTPCSAPAAWPDRGRAALAGRAARVLFTLTGGEDAALRAAGLPTRPIRRIPPAADLPGTPRPAGFRRGLGLDGDAVLFVGRRTAYKGYLALLQATRAVWAALPATRFVFIGPDTDADAAAHFQAHADPRLHDLGVVDERTKHDALAACAVLCLPSSTDVFPLVFVEAWSCGKPVVGGDFAGADQVIRHGVDGLVVRPRPHDVAGALVRLLGDPRARLAMGRAGAERARREFGWDRVAAAYEDGYRWALAPTSEGVGS